MGQIRQYLLEENMKNFISLRDFSYKELTALLDRADYFSFISTGSETGLRLSWVPKKWEHLCPSFQVNQGSMSRWKIQPDIWETGFLRSVFTLPASDQRARSIT
jgi:hypothetical protein